MSAKIKWLKQLYIGNSISKDKVLLYKLKFKTGNRNVCVIVPSDREDELLQIISGKEASLKIYDGKKYLVGGIAANKAEAIKLIEDITNDCLKIRGDLDLKEYIKCGQFY